MENPLSKLTRREQYGLVGFVVLLISAVLGTRAYSQLGPAPLKPTGGAIALAPEDPTPSPQPSPTPLKELVVYVTGAVKQPGIYYFKPGQRLHEAVKKAGGFRADANREALNLADTLKDADQLHISVKPSPKEPAPCASTASNSRPIRRSVVTLVPPAPVHVVARRSIGRVLGMGTGTTSNGKAAPAQKEAQTPAGEAKTGEIRTPEDGTVNINTADETELQRLPGVGPAIAGRIIAYRQEAGQFQALEDLMEVKGIGEKTFAKLKPLITI